MTKKEQNLLQNRIRTANGLRGRIESLTSLQGILTASNRREVTVHDHASGVQKWRGFGSDLLAGVKLQIAALNTELADC